MVDNGRGVSACNRFTSVGRGLTYSHSDVPQSDVQDIAPGKADTTDHWLKIHISTVKPR